MKASSHLDSWDKIKPTVLSMVPQSKYYHDLSISSIFVYQMAHLVLDYDKSQLYILCCGQKYKQTDKAPPESGKVLKKI